MASLAYDIASHSLPQRAAPSRQSRYRDSHARILKAAFDCALFSQDGQPSIDAVARLSGVSRPTVYAHFATKDELIQAAFEHVLRPLAANLASARLWARWDQDVVSAYAAAVTGHLLDERYESAARAMLIAPHDRPWLDRLIETYLRQPQRLTFEAVVRRAASLYGRQAALHPEAYLGFFTNLEGRLVLPRLMRGRRQSDAAEARSTVETELHKAVSACLAVNG
jgi:AcrR family transcriptional regulator